MLRPKKGMFTEGDRMFAGGTPNFDERTGQPRTPAPAPAPAPEEMTFTFIEGSERGDAKPGELWGQTVEPRQVTESELRDFFNDPERTNRLPEVFGTFENYLGYMTEREQLLQSGDLTLGDWGSAANIGGPTETITLEDGTEVEIPAIDIGMSIGGGGELGIGGAGGGGGANLAAEAEIMLQRGAYEDWLNSEVNQALLQKYGVNPVVYSETGDKFQWNGSSYVKTVDIKNPDAGDFVKSGILAAITFYAGGPLTQALGPVFGGNTALAAGASAGITNSAMQLLATGEVDLGQALQSALSAGLSTSAINYLQESGALDALTESLNELTQDTVRLADGTELPLNQVSTGVYEVTLPSGNTIGYEAFAQVAESLMGSPIVAEVTRSLPDWINDVADAFAASGTAQGVVDLLQSTQGGPSAAGATASGDLNFQPSDVTFLDQLREAIEREENPETRAALEEELRRYEEDEEEVDVTEEDTVEDTDSELADTTTTSDTTTDAEENPPGITEEMFQDVVDQVRADNQVKTQEIIDAINALGVADLPTLAQIEAAFPELNDVSLEQIKDTVSTLLSEAGLLTTEQFTEAMAGVLTPEQLATALANLPYGDAEDFIDAIANAGYATPEDVATALNNADLMSNEDFSTYMEQFREDIVGDVGTLLDAAFADFAFPETFTEEQIQQLRDSIVIPESATMEQIQTALDALAEQIPAAPTLEEMQTLFNTELANLDIASPDDIREILANYGFTQEQLDQIAGAINIPPSATVADVERIIAGIPPGLSVEEITSALGSEFDALAEGISGVQAGVNDLAEQLGLTSDELINAINALSTKSSDELTETERNIIAGLTGLADSFNTDLSGVVGSISGLSEDVVSGITTLGGQIETGFANVQEGIDGLADQLGITTEQLIGVLEGLEGRTTDQLSDLETSVISGLAGLGTNFGVGISGVLESITGLSTDVVSGISDLSGQLTGVQSGIDDLADQLGLTTDELINAISNLSVKTSDQLTDIDRSIIDGLSGLATSFNTDITGVVGSITGLGADVASGISGISSQISGLETAVTTGIEDLADQLNVSTNDIVNAVISIGSGLGGELTDLETSVLAGLGNIADVLGTDIENVVGSIGGLGSDVVEGFAGISGELQTGFGQLGQQLGLLTAGLFGLGARQPTAQQIAAAQDKFDFKPFEEKASPRQVQQVVRSEPIKQQPSALQQLNQFLDKQATTPQKPPRKPGMLA